MRITRTHVTPARLVAASAALALAAGLAACSSDGEPATATPSASKSSTASAAQKSSTGVEVHDAWVKAADTGMTGVFGTIHNHGVTEVHYVRATNSVGGRTELHETVPNGAAMTMREAADGFRIPAGGELELKPGANHIMLMDLPKPITTGQEVEITLTADDGTKLTFTAVARSFAGGDEKYQGGESSTGAPAHGEGAGHTHG